MAWVECKFAEIPAGLGGVPTSHNGRWYALSGNKPMRWTGAGATTTLPNTANRPVITAANDLLDYFNIYPCTQASIGAVSEFQSAYNASGQPGQLTVDGQYGGNTQKALQNVMDLAQADAGAGPSQAAPTNCFGMAVPATPALDPPTGPSNPLTPPSSVNPWLIAGAVILGGAGIAYAVHLKKKRRRA